LSIKNLVGNRYLKSGLGLLIGGVSFYLAVRGVAFSEFKSAIENANLPFVGLALLSTAVIVVGRVFRWKLLLGSAGYGISHKKSLMALLAGQALNLIYPARVGDLSRAYLLDETGQGRVYILGTVVLEKLFDSITYVLIFFLLFSLLPLPTWLSSSGYTFAILTFISVIIIVILAYRVEWVLKSFQSLTARFPLLSKGRFVTWIQSGLQSLAILRNKRDLVKLLILSLVIWVIPIFTNHFTLLALQIQLPLTASILTMLVLQASVAIPSIPGRIGLFEYLCVLSLSLFGISESPAFTYGVLLHVIALLPSTILGLIFLWVLGFYRNKGMLKAMPVAEAGDLRIQNSADIDNAS
jgi:glycosyltransferase 2 family protein